MSVYIYIYIVHSYCKFKNLYIDSCVLQSFLQEQGCSMVLPENHLSLLFLTKNLRLFKTKNFLLEIRQIILHVNKLYICHCLHNNVFNVNVMSVVLYLQPSLLLLYRRPDSYLPANLTSFVLGRRTKVA